MTLLQQYFEVALIVVSRIFFALDVEIVFLTSIIVIHAKQLPQSWNTVEFASNTLAISPECLATPSNLFPSKYKEYFKNVKESNINEKNKRQNHSNLNKMFWHFKMTKVKRNEMISFSIR